MLDVPSSTRGSQDLDPQAGAMFESVVQLQRTPVMTQSTSSLALWPHKIASLGPGTSSTPHPSSPITTDLMQFPSGQSDTVEASVGSGQDGQQRETSNLQSIRGGPCSNGLASQGLLS